MSSENIRQMFRTIGQQVNVQNFLIKSTWLIRNWFHTSVLNFDAIHGLKINLFWDKDRKISKAIFLAFYSSRLWTTILPNSTLASIMGQIKKTNVHRVDLNAISWIWANLILLKMPQCRVNRDLKTTKCLST